jgi:hypothetical protein
MATARASFSPRGEGMIDIKIAGFIFLATSAALLFVLAVMISRLYRRFLDQRYKCPAENPWAI